MRAARVIAFVTGTLMAFVACNDTPAAPRAQWRVLLVTDAPIPHFGDRIVVEVTDPATGALACDGCRRQLAVTETTMWPVTFGIVPGADIGKRLVLRARLFRTDHSGATGLPVSSAAIDRLGSLPPVADAVTDVGLVLAAACFGTPSDPIARTTCNPITNEAEPAQLLAALSVSERELRPGAWPPSREQPCPGEPPSKMQCLPGGVFFLGDDTILQRGIELDPVPERLVQLAPFFIDVDELTVGTFRTLVNEGGVSEGRVVSKLKDVECTYLSKDDRSNDELPMTCIDHGDAETVCAALGKRLPTEAEWEYAAGGGTDESRFPWGSTDQDICARAIVGRARSALGENSVPGIDFSTKCRVPASGALLPYGALAGGNDKDVTKHGVRNMGGNMKEWVADAFAAHSTSCLGKPRGLHVNPKCASDHPDVIRGAFTVKGGGWPDHPGEASGAHRTGIDAANTRINVGFRCAK
jgi:formylglycine-generating enzyme